MRILKISKAHRVLITSAIVLFALVLLGALAKGWLESPQGRALLQRELSKSLGMAAEIDEGYELGFFPRLSIDGTGLVIAGPGGKGTFVSSKSFQANIELMPLLRQQVKITSIELSDGLLDFNHAPTDSTPEGEGARNKATLPQVGSLIVEDFLIHLGKGDLAIDLERLYLTDFKAGAEVPIELEAAIIDGAGTKARFLLGGELTLGDGQSSVLLEMNELQLESGGFSLKDVTGSWHWLSEPGTLDGRLAWVDGQRGASIDLGIKFGETLSGAISGQYNDGELQGRVETDFRLDETQDYLEMGDISLEVAGQAAKGRGCVVWADVPALKLMLASDELDLDALQSLLPEGQGEELSLPVELEISLSIARALLEGAEAVDTKVIIGAEPTCP